MAIRSYMESLCYRRTQQGRIVAQKSRIHRDIRDNDGVQYSVKRNAALIERFNYTQEKSLGLNNKARCKGKSVPFQARSGPEGSRKLRFPDFMTTAQDGGKVSFTHRSPLPPGNAPGTHFC